MALGQKFRCKLQQKLPRVMLHPGPRRKNVDESWQSRDQSELSKLGLPLITVIRLPPPQAIQPVMSYEYARSQVEI